MKKPPSKNALKRPNFFFRLANRPKTCPNLNFMFHKNCSPRDLWIMTLFKGFMQRCCRKSCKNEPRSQSKSSKMFDPFNVNWRNFVGRKDFLNWWKIKSVVYICSKVGHYRVMTLVPVKESPLFYQFQLLSCPHWLSGKSKQTLFIA